MCMRWISKCARHNALLENENLIGTSFSALEILPKILAWRLKDHDDFRHFYVRYFMTGHSHSDSNFRPDVRHRIHNLFKTLQITSLHNSLRYSVLTKILDTRTLSTLNVTFWDSTDTGKEEGVTYKLSAHINSHMTTKWKIIKWWVKYTLTKW